MKIEITLEGNFVNIKDAISFFDNLFNQVYERSLQDYKVKVNSMAVIRLDE